MDVFSNIRQFIQYRWGLIICCFTNFYQLNLLVPLAYLILVLFGKKYHKIVEFALEMVIWSPFIISLRYLIFLD